METRTIVPNSRCIVALQNNYLFDFGQIWNINLPITVEKIVSNVEGSLRKCGEVCSRLNSCQAFCKITVVRILYLKVIEKMMRIVLGHNQVSNTDGRLTRKIEAMHLRETMR